MNICLLKFVTPEDYKSKDLIEVIDKFTDMYEKDKHFWRTSLRSINDPDGTKYHYLKIIDWYINAAVKNKDNLKYRIYMIELFEFINKYIKILKYLPHMKDAFITIAEAESHNSKFDNDYTQFFTYSYYRLKEI